MLQSTVKGEGLRANIQHAHTHVLAHTHTRSHIHFNQQVEVGALASGGDVHLQNCLQLV